MMCFDNWICCVVSALEHLISGVDETLRCIRETGGEKEREREREQRTSLPPSHRRSPGNRLAVDCVHVQTKAGLSLCSSLQPLVRPFYSLNDRGRKSVGTTDVREIRRAENVLRCDEATASLKFGYSKLVLQASPVQSSMLQRRSTPASCALVAFKFPEINNPALQCMLCSSSSSS